MYFYIERDRIDSSVERLIQSCNKFGHKTIFYDKYELDYDELNNCVSFLYCSINELKLARKAVPNLYINDKFNFDFLYKNGYHKGLLFQRNVKFTPWSCLLEAARPEYYDFDEAIDDLSNESQTFFVRPNSCFKQFNGQTISKTNLIEWYNFNSTLIDLKELCVLSKARDDIKYEIRTFVSGGVIKTYSIYNNDKPIRNASITNVINRCQKLLNALSNHPHNLYIADFAVTYGNIPSLLETNSIHCAGLYDMDVDVIVNEIQKWSTVLQST